MLNTYHITVMLLGYQKTYRCCYR